jgi:hypothetical protein
MPRGGKREGAGRPKGSRNVATKQLIANLSELAREHTQTALDALVQIAKSGDSEAARVSAATAILDRGYGRPQQSVDHTSSDGTMSPAREVQDAALDAMRRKHGAG